MVSCKITNVVVAARLSAPRSLQQFAHLLRRAGYAARLSRHARSVTVKHGKMCAVLRPSAVWCTGTAGAQEALCLLERLAGVLGGSVSEARVVNATAVCTTGVRISQNAWNSIGLFLPGAALRDHNPPHAVIWRPSGARRATVLLYRSGKAVVVGVRSVAEACEVIEQAVALLRRADKEEDGW